MFAFRNYKKEMSESESEYEDGGKMSLHNGYVSDPDALELRFSTKF